MKWAKADNYYPIAFGAVAAAAYLVVFSICPKYALLKGFRDLFMAAVTINSISIGFLATAKATMISINNSRIVRWMKETGTYETSIKYFSDAVNLSLCCAVWSSLLLLIDFEDPTRFILAGIAIWVFLCTSATLGMYRIIQLFSKILLNRPLKNK